MKFIYLTVFIVTITAISCNDELDEDIEILRSCLTKVPKRKLTAIDLQKVARYSEWTEEEIPCFTRCIAAEKGWFDIELHKWNKQKIADDLGANMYNYCRFELDRPFQNVCEFAYKGLKCLKQAEVQISVTHANLLNCAEGLHANMEQLQKYVLFPPKEEVGCLFKCFAEKMNFYKNDYEWNFSNWIQAFGPIKYENVNSNICKASSEKIREYDKCEWMYEEYICLERLHYNTLGVEGLDARRR